MSEPVVTKNELTVMQTQFIHALSNIHIALCLSENAQVQHYLNSAMHSILIRAEQCRAIHSKNIGDNNG